MKELKYLQIIILLQNKLPNIKCKLYGTHCYVYIIVGEITIYKNHSSLDEDLIKRGLTT